MIATLRIDQTILSLILVASLVQPLLGFVPEPRFETKYQTSNAPDNVILHEEKSSSAKSDLTNDSSDDENRITISEPYKSLIQTTARFAVAQSSLTDYVTVDTFMDVVGDASYALSKPSILGKALKTAAVLVVTLLASAFVLPVSIIHGLGSILRNPDRLTKLERHLPIGLSEMGVINLLNERTDDLISRFKLNDSSCRQQTICHAGEQLRCTFPRASKMTIDFVSENFSLQKYRSNKYLNAFMTGFIDQNCANIIELDESAQSKSCACNFIKSISICSSTYKSATQSNSSSVSTSQKSNYQSLRAVRA